jgi:hypothetical protein
MRQLLCIGGTAAGEVAPDLDGREYMQVSVPRPIHPPVTKSLAQMTEAITIHTYRRMTFNFRGGEYREVWGLESMEPSDVFDVLLKEYAR